jgi:hypothetical protein
VLPWTRVTADNRDGLVGRIPRRPLATPQPFCLDCALQLAAQVTISFNLIQLNEKIDMQIDLNIQIGQNMQIHGPRADEFISCVEDEGIELTD